MCDVWGTCSEHTSESTHPPTAADGSSAVWGFVAAASYYVYDFSLMGRRRHCLDVRCSRLFKIGSLLYLANILLLPFFPSSPRVNRNRGAVCVEPSLFYFHTAACWIWRQAARADTFPCEGLVVQRLLSSYFPRWIFNSEWITPPLPSPHQCWMNESSLRNTTNGLLLYIIFPIPAEEGPVLKPRSFQTTEPGDVKTWDFCIFFFLTPAW